MPPHLAGNPHFLLLVGAIGASYRLTLNCCQKIYLAAIQNRWRARNLSVPQSPVVEVEGKRLSLSNLDKVLYPATGFTKGQVIDYYARIAPALLPHLQGRR